MCTRQIDGVPKCRSNVAEFGCIFSGKDIMKGYSFSLNLSRFALLARLRVMRDAQVHL